MPASDDTLLRQLKRGATRRINDVRVLGVDDWSWRKGESYGTVMVDLERREVVDVLPGRSTEETADWLRQHPNVEVVSLPIPTKAPVCNGIMPPGDSGIMAPPFYEMIPPGRRVR